MTTDLVARAQAGDEQAFGQLVDAHRDGLAIHCYRILGSLQDADDVVQETLLAAWQGLREFEGRASVRTWLYRIATNRCLNALRSRRRSPLVILPRPAQPPEPTRFREVIWLEPYPDARLEGLADERPGPEARYETKEAISLAFVTVLQLLPPRQRAVLVLRDVLGFRGKEVADMLDSTEDSIAGALKRARASLHDRMPSSDQAEPVANSAAERDLVARLTRAYESGDVDGVVALLTDDAVLTTPLSPAEFAGREVCARFLSVVFSGGRKHRLLPTRANGQPAFGVYVRDPVTDLGHASGMIVLTLRGDRITTMTHFDNSVLAHFALPRTVPW